MNAGEELGEPEGSWCEFGSELEDGEVPGEDRIHDDVGGAYQEDVRHEEWAGWGQVVSWNSFLGS